MKILFSCVGRRVELMQAFHRAAEKLKMEVELYGTDITETAPAMFFCDHRVLMPRISDEQYLPRLLKVCEEERIDALIPLIDTDLNLLAANRSKFEAVGTRVLVGDADKVALCRDKLKTAEYFQRLGLACPVTVDSIERYDSGFPAFIKPRNGSSSIGAHCAHDRLELEAFAQETPNYMIQPYVSGVEYSVDALCDLEGNPVLVTPRIRLALRTGEVLKTQIDQDDRIIEETMRILADFKPRGQLSIQLIRDKATGVDYFIEINPRFGGGAPMSILAGADSAEMILRILSGEKLSYQPKVAENGAVYSRFDQSIRVK